jgi:hypothetical protein
MHQNFKAKALGFCSTWTCSRFVIFANNSIVFLQSFQSKIQGKFKCDSGLLGTKFSITAFVNFTNTHSFTMVFIKDPAAERVL